MRRLLLASVMLVAACGQKSAVSTETNSADNQAFAINSVNTASAVNEGANQTQESSAVSANEAQAGNALASLPPANADLRFVGLWAKDAANCASHGWRFTADGLTGPDAPHCSFYKVTKMPGGYDLAARCPAKKPVELDLIKLRFAESARAMLVESNAIKPTGLIYCGK